MKNQLMRTFEHVTWANMQVLNALQLTKSQHEKSFRLFTHVLAAEQIWLTRLNENDSSQMDIWPERSIEECGNVIKENSEGYTRFLDQITDNDLLRYVSYRNSKGVEFNTTIMDILTHVSLHGSYHRGQISSYLRMEGFAPVNTDYISFVRQL